MRTLSFLLLTTFLTSTAAFAQSTNAPAQNEPAQADGTQGEDVEFGEIVVTAQKRTERAFETPLTITALTGETINRLGITRFDELSRFTPGLFIQEQSPNNPGFVIRGITSDSGVSQIAQRITIFYNGIDISRSRGSSFALFDLERVEVVKGPQSTLFGQAAAVGAVSVITKKAGKEDEVMLRAGVGNFGYYRLGGVLNLGNDIVGVRLAVDYQKRDGFVENIAGRPGSQTPNGPEIGDLNGLDALGARFSLRYEPSDRFRSDFIFSYDLQTPPGIAFVSGVFAPTGAARPDPFNFVELGGAPNSRSTLGLDRLGVDREVRDFNFTNVFEVSDKITLTSITGYRDFDSLEVFDADGTAAAFAEFAEDAEGRQYSQELRVNFDYDIIRGFFGANYFNERGSQSVPFTANEREFLQCVPAVFLAGTPRPIAGQGCFGPNGQVVARSLAPVIYTSRFTNTGRVENISFFADATVKPLEGLELTAGVRYLTERRTSGFFSLVPPAATRITIPGQAQPLPLIPTQVNTGNILVSRSARNDAFLPRFNIRFQPTDNISLFLTASEGRVSPVVVVNGAAGSVSTGFTPLPDPVRSPMTANLAPEKVWNYEGGIKFTKLPLNTSLELGVFFQDYTNFQTTSTDVPAITSSIGTASNKGVELEIRTRPIDQVQLFGTFSYIDGKFGDDIVNGTFRNQRFRLQPKVTASFGAFIDFQLSDNLKLDITPSITYTSKLFFEAPNAPRNGVALSQSKYALVNLRAGLEIGEEGRYRIEAFVTNLTDKEFLIDAGNTGATFGSTTIIPGAPRFAGVEAIVKF